MSGSPIGAEGFIKESSAFVVRGNPLGIVLIPLGEEPVIGKELRELSKTHYRRNFAAYG